MSTPKSAYGTVNEAVPSIRSAETGVTVASKVT